MNVPIWTLVAGTLAWCGAALAVSFTMAAQRRQRGSLITEGKKELAVMAVFLTLPFMLLSGLLPWATARVVLNFTYGWVTPCKLLLLCVANFLLDSPAWTLSSFSHFLLAMLLPVRIKDVVAQGGGRQEARRRLNESCRTLMVEVGLLMLYFCCYDSAGETARHVAHGVVLYLVLDLPHRIASMGFLLLHGVETHPAFSRPWFSESLTDFWANRWDLTANALLRHSVYNPLVNLLLDQTSTATNDIDIQLQQVPSSARPAKVEVVKRSTFPSSSPLMSPSKPLPLWVRLVGVNTTFFISGLIHELLYFSLTQAATPTWEVTAFFIVHGLATSTEITLRRRAGSSTKDAIASIPRPIKVAFTMFFMYATTASLFFPQLVRAGMFSTRTLELRTVGNMASATVPDPKMLFPLGPISLGSLLI